MPAYCYIFSLLRSVLFRVFYSFVFKATQCCSVDPVSFSKILSKAYFQDSVCCSRASSTALSSCSGCQSWKREATEEKCCCHHYTGFLPWLAHKTTSTCLQHLVYKILIRKIRLFSNMDRLILFLVVNVYGGQYFRSEHLGEKLFLGLQHTFSFH